MKKTPFQAAAILALAVLGSAPALKAQTWSPTMDRSYWAFRCSFFDAQRIFAVGVPGTLLRSADGGDTWIESAMPKDQSEFTLQATHPDTGWLWSDDTLYRSVDGMATWTFRTSFDVRNFHCQFLNGTQGFMAHRDGGLYATLDGGATWILRRQADRKGFQSLNFLDPQHGFALEGDSSGSFSTWKYSSLRTADSGKTWTALVLPPDVQAALGYQKSVHFTSLLEGTVKVVTAASQELELSTKDGGASWSRREIPKHGYSVYGSIGESFLYGEDPNASSPQRAAVSKDGGVTWNPLTGVFPDRVVNMYWRHPDTGWAIGTSFLFGTTDGGKTWTRRIGTLNGYDNVEDVLFQDPLVGWAAHDRSIYRTTDGGLSWSLQATSAVTHWFTLHLADALGTRTLVKLGTRSPSGPIVHVIGTSKDGGSTWRETVLDSLVEARGIAFGSAQTGYALVDHTNRDSLGLLKTTDRGDNWSLLRLPYRAFGTQIQFLDEDNGFLAASGLDVDSMLIVRVGQGGETSSVAARFPKPGFAGMHWEDTQRGWVVSRDTVHRTVDGGATWSKTGLGSWKGSTRVVALDARNAAILADAGRLLKTSDGFATWSVEILPIQIRDVLFLPSGDGYALGGQGQLMKYSARPVPLRRRAPPRRSAGNAGPRFESGAMHLQTIRKGRAGIRPVDASGRRIGGP